MPWLHFGYRAASLNGVSYAKLQQTMKDHESVACCGMLVKHGQTWSNHVHWSILLRQICSHFVFAQVDVDVLRFVVPVVSRHPFGMNRKRADSTQQELVPQHLKVTVETLRLCDL